MTTTTVYRVQPFGLDLGDHRSLTSNDEQDRGVHVFSCEESLWGGVYGWCDQGYQPELVAIECDDKDLRDNGDYEGYVLLGNRGRIVSRQAFASWEALAEMAREFLRK